MSGDCLQEECGHWTGDGRACACAMFDLEPSTPFFDPADLADLANDDAWLEDRGLL